MSVLENIAELTRTPLQSFFNGGINVPALPDDPALAELITIYSQIDDHQKMKLLEYARDRKSLSEYNKTHGSDILVKKTKHK
jgi:hypothetical protein